MTRVLGYARVSTDEQAQSGAGLAAQETAIRAACEAKGYELLEIVVDEGCSAKDLIRPGVSEVLERLEAGEADALMVAKLDRLSRSVLDFASLVEQARKKGWAIVCLDLGVDTATAAGEMMANVLATFAQFERRLISERTKAALAEKKRQGVHIGRPRSVPISVVQEIEILRLGQGLSYARIGRELERQGIPTGQGGRRWWSSTVKMIHDREACV